MEIRIIPAILLVCSFTVSAQQETLLEIARRSAPNPVYQSRSSELVLAEMDTAISEVVRIFYGIVERRTTYLSTDKKSLYTDYIIRPLRVMNRCKALRPILVLDYYLLSLSRGGEERWY
jgi:hypothetical protein